MEKENLKDGDFSLPYVFYKLEHNKIKASWNKKPIKMDLFLSFLKVPVTISRDHLGFSNGYTLRVNEELKLKIGGGIEKGEEYLDSLQFGEKLGNIYNNYVNPFFLKGILTKEGLEFFYEYYKEDINELFAQQEREITILKNKVQIKEGILDLMIQERDSFLEYYVY